MKQVIILLAGISMCLSGLAQTDSTNTEKQNDTITVGGMIIIRKHDRQKDNKPQTNHHKKRSSRVSTNWGIVDLGFANYTDNTDYTSAAMQNPVNGFAPGLDKD